MKFCSLIICLWGLVFFASKSYGYETGAPTRESPEVCKTMTPGHSGTAPQTGAHQYTIDVTNPNPIGGDSVGVQIRGGHQYPFEGFFLMAVKLDQHGAPEETGIPHGSWSFQQDQSAKTVSCGGRPDGAVTHVDKKPKDRVSLQWKVPNEEGYYVILVTFLKDFSTYWVKVRSQPIRVRKDSQSEAERPGSPHSFPTEVNSEAKKVLEDFGKGCGKSKGCEGLPVGCIDRGVSTCEMMATFLYDGTNFLFQIAGKLPTMVDQGHVSIGLSFDQYMGNDSVTGCVMQNSKVSPKSYYNFPEPSEKQNVIATDPLEGLIEPSGGGYKGGVLYCEFKRKPISKLVHDIPGKTKSTLEFNLTKDKYYILLARAGEIKKLQGTDREKLGRHPEQADRGSSPVSYLLTEFKNTPTTTKNKTPKGGASSKSFQINVLFTLLSFVMCYF